MRSGGEGVGFWRWWKGLFAFGAIGSGALAVRQKIGESDAAVRAWFERGVGCADGRATAVNLAMGVRALAVGGSWREESVAARAEFFDGRISEF